MMSMTVTVVSTLFSIIEVEMVYIICDDNNI